MRRILFMFAASVVGQCAITNVVVLDPSAQQGIVQFTAPDPTLCTITVYSDAAMTLKMDDTNNSLFAGSENCNRAGNIVNGKTVTAVLGKRTSETSADTAVPIRSRGLAVATAYYVKIVDGTDSSTATATFTTANIPWGRTNIEMPQVLNAQFGGYAYPDMDWTDAGQAKSYIDPLSGVAYSRGARITYGEGGLYGTDAGVLEVHKFDAPIDVKGTWTNVANILNASTGGSDYFPSTSGPFATYSGTTRDAVVVPFPYTVDGLDPSDRRAQPFRFSFQATSENSPQAMIDDVGCEICGSATGSTADRTVNVCLVYNYAPGVNGAGADTCLGTVIPVILPTSAGCQLVPATYPKWQYSGWGLPRFLKAEEWAIFGGANASVSSSVVTLDNSEFLPANAATGMKIRIGSTWYTIGTITTAASFTLQESSITVGTSSWYMGNFGVRISKATTTNNTISVAAGFAYVEWRNPEFPANTGARDFFSRVTFPVTFEADGVTAQAPVNGRLMINGDVTQVLQLLIDPSPAHPAGEMRMIAPLSGRVTDVAVPMLGAFSLTDPYTYFFAKKDPSDITGGSSFWKGVYAPSTCHFKSWPGNNYSGTVANTCITYTNLNPYSDDPTKTINYQIAAALASDPYWDSSFTAAYPFKLRAFSSHYAIFSAQVPQGNAVCWNAIFDLNTLTLVKEFNTFSGQVPGIRWSGCHSAGVSITDGGTNMSIDFAFLTRQYHDGGTFGSYLNGPYDLSAFTAKSLDGGSTWNADTSLTNTQAFACGTNPYGVTGAQCVKLKIATDEACNTNSSTWEGTKWPCVRSAGANHSSGGQLAGVGDYVFQGLSLGEGPGDYDGKREGMRILSDVSDGSGGRIWEVQRWSLCDNQTGDPNGSPPACTYYDHIQSAIGSIHYNGWAAYMGVSRGATWMDITSSAGSTVWSVDASPITSNGHYATGIGPDGTTRMSYGYGAARLGNFPGATQLPMSATLNVQNDTFNGIAMPGDNQGDLESYPTASNWNSPTKATRSNYWNWRHINPSAGVSGDAPIHAWSHTYTLQGGTTSVYKVSVHGSLGTTAPILKARPPVAFSTRKGFTDISSPSTGNVITDSSPFTYCLAYKANECRTGSSVGDVYVVAPGAYIEFGACLANSFKTWTPCVAVPQAVAGWLMEGDSQHDDPAGVRWRRLTMGQAMMTQVYGYGAPRLTPESNLAVLAVNWPNGMRKDGIVMRMPPPVSADGIDRRDYINVPVALPANSGFARVKFGYVENGTAGQYYCTSRLETCVTDASAAPFAYVTSDSLTPTNCSSACTVNVPALSGRVLYYVVQRSRDGSTNWIDGPPQARAIP